MLPSEALDTARPLSVAVLLLLTCRGSQACCQLSSLVARASSARAARTRPLAATHAAVAAYEVIQANACTGTGEHSASEARRCLHFLPHFRGRRSFAPAPRRTRAPRSAATAPARGASVPSSAQRAARDCPRTAGGELALTRRRTRGVRRGARRRQAAATRAVRAALLYAAVARPSCRAIGRGAAC